MDLTAFLLAVPIFFLAYQGVGYFIEARGPQKWDGSSSPAETALTPFKMLGAFSVMITQLGFNKALLRNKKLSGRLDLLLVRSGHPFGWKIDDLLFIKELGVVLALFMLWRVGNDQPFAWVMGAFLGFWLPDVYVKAKGTARQASIQRQLPGFVDLLALTLESGLDLMVAAERILEKMKPSSLREELFTLLQENRLGEPRKSALEHLAYRVNLPDLHALTSIIIQSEELGTSLASVLRNYAEDMRNKRITRAEEIAGKAPVKLLLPMMVFFFPIIFVIIFGPLALNFMSSYK